MNDPRLDEILDVLIAIAQRDFTRRAPVHGTDTIDALATGLNMLAEELDGEVASRAELESAYAALQQAQTKVVQSEKMAAIGLLASGVAHEINNPAAWVSLSLGILRKSVTTLENEDNLHSESARQTLAQMKTLLDDAIDGVARITTVVQDLRTLSRSDDRTIDEVSFRDVVAAACRLAASALDRTRVEVRVEDQAIVANRGRVAQIVTNLLVNAAHAVRAVDDPRIIVSTRSERDGVVLAVEDNGPGIPPQLRKTVFDPFYTTKGPTEGTGLGLTIVSQIASNGGGWARAVDAHEGKGARVEVFFPNAR
jgi:C4-dicarboxylate-specific signal transduction histidine kinase